MKPDLTQSGLGSLAMAVRNILANKVSRVELGHNTVVYRVSSPNSKEYTIRVDMKIEGD